MERSGTPGLIPLNPFDPRTRADPYPLYQYIRTVEPVHKSQAGFWLLTRYADCRAVLEDGRWSHSADAILEPGRGEDAPVDPTVRLLRASILFQDPPRHAEHLRVLEKAAGRGSQDARESIEAIATRLLSLMRETDGSADVITEYARPLALVFLGDMLGVPSDDRSTIQRWGHHVVGGLEPFQRMDAVVSAGAAAVALAEYFIGRLDGAEAGTPLAAIRDAAGGLRTWELVADLVAFLITGLETSTALIGNALLALLRNQPQLREVQHDPGLLATTGLDELIRFDSPLHLTARSALEDVAIAGSTIAKGEQALVLIGAANRDPADFENPDRIDLTRSPNRHLGFGAGTHACFAAPAARLLATTALALFLERFPDVSLEDEPQWQDSITIRALDHLPVRLWR